MGHRRCFTRTEANLVAPQGGIRRRCEDLSLLVWFLNQPPGRYWRSVWDFSFGDVVEGGESGVMAVSHWQPAITVKPDGTKVLIAWYDRRADTASNSLIQIWGAFANVPITTNSFTTNFLISTAQFPPIFSGTNINSHTFQYTRTATPGPTPESLVVAQAGNSAMPPELFTYMPSGQSGYFFRSSFVSVDNAPFGGYVWLQVRAWDTRLGTSYDEVAALGLGGYGESPLFYTYGGDLGGSLPPQPCEAFNPSV
jgi:hypothetical protein